MLTCSINVVPWGLSHQIYIDFIREETHSDNTSLYLIYLFIQKNNKIKSFISTLNKLNGIQYYNNNEIVQININRREFILLYNVYIYVVGPLIKPPIWIHYMYADTRLHQKADDNNQTCLQVCADKNYMTLIRCYFHHFIILNIIDNLLCDHYLFYIFLWKVILYKITYCSFLLVHSGYCLLISTVMPTGDIRIITSIRDDLCHNSTMLILRAFILCVITTHKYNDQRYFHDNDDM